VGRCTHRGAILPGDQQRQPAGVCWCVTMAATAT
jgi:hypothetical protein